MRTRCWAGAAVTGEVTLRLRRGEDYSILDASGPAFSYHPDKLSMERTDAELVGAAAAHTGLVGDMVQGGAEAIASRGEVDADEELLDRAAMEVGTD